MFYSGLPLVLRGLRMLTVRDMRLRWKSLDETTMRFPLFITELQNFAFPEQENTYQNTEDLIGNYLGRYMTYVKPDFSVKNYTCFNASDDWKIVPWRDVFAKATSSFNAVAVLTQERGPHVCIGINFTCAVNVAFY